MAELMASFCDNLLKKGGSEKLGDEDLEAVLDKVVKMLAYISGGCGGGVNVWMCWGGQGMKGRTERWV